MVTVARAFTDTLSGIALADVPAVVRRQALRRKDTPHDALGLAEGVLTDDQLLDAMMAHPILIKRPLAAVKAVGGRPYAISARR